MDDISPRAMREMDAYHVHRLVQDLVKLPDKEWEDVEDDLHGAMTLINMRLEDRRRKALQAAE